MALVPLVFITNEEFLVRYDWRWVAKNMLDAQYGTSNKSVSTYDNLVDPLSEEGGTTLATLINEASELVMAAAAVGARYSVDDLLIVPDATPPRPGGGALLQRIVSDLTMGLILKRRARATEDTTQLFQPYAEALEYIEQLRRGERIFFMVPLVPEAGLPEAASSVPIPGIDPPNITQQSLRLFGNTGWNYPYGPPN